MADEEFHVVSKADVISARLARYDSNAGDLGGYAFLGTVSTISNGFVLIFTAPVWIVGGLTAMGFQHNMPLITCEICDFSKLSPYARFPAGLPDGINRSQIRMSPGGI
ncbi:MAG: hypothetical protein GF417_12655 [Candidatus Latescibacteria bacterium]|nr:hypothetical protein [bacterium]MBD3425279.1 hypothetical protein [Candidatus Latescibacterota bacterium]